jgi:hypothetical protein
MRREPSRRMAAPAIEVEGNSPAIEVKEIYS